MKRCRAFPIRESGHKADVVKSVCRIKVLHTILALIRAQCLTVYSKADPKIRALN